jgi:hypothetical protein
VGFWGFDFQMMRTIKAHNYYGTEPCDTFTEPHRAHYFLYFNRKQRIYACVNHYDDAAKLMREIAHDEDFDLRGSELDRQELDKITTTKDNVTA